MDSHGNLIAISLLFFHPAYFPSAKFRKFWQSSKIKRISF